MQVLIFIGTLLFCVLSLSSQAQKGLELSLGLSPSFSFIANKNDAEDASVNHKTSFGHLAQFTVGHNFNSTIGVGTGLGFVYFRQNYVKKYSAHRIDVLQHKVQKELHYVRLPAFLCLRSNPKLGTCFFMRLGLHLDVLLTAGSRIQYPFDQQLPNKWIDYRNLQNIPKEPLEVFSPLVLGFSLDVGSKIQLSEQIGLLVLLHVESSLSNLEGKDAATQLPATLKIVHERKVSWTRAQSWGILLGINIGVTYRLPFRGYFYQKKRKFRTHYWS